MDETKNNGDGEISYKVKNVSNFISEPLEKPSPNEKMGSRDYNKIHETLEEYKCPICMDVYVKTSVISCGHRFCLSCIKQWFHHSFPRRFCPVCRKNCIYFVDDSTIDKIVSDLFGCLPRDEQEDRRKVIIDREYPSPSPPPPLNQSESQQMYFDGFINQLSQWQNDFLSPMTDPIFPPFHPTSTPSDLIYGRDGWQQAQSVINQHTENPFGSSFLDSNQFRIESIMSEPLNLNHNQNHYSHNHPMNDRRSFLERPPQNRGQNQSQGPGHHHCFDYNLDQNATWQQSNDPPPPTILRRPNSMNLGSSSGHNFIENNLMNGQDYGSKFGNYRDVGHTMSNNHGGGGGGSSNLKGSNSFHLGDTRHHWNNQQQHSQVQQELNGWVGANFQNYGHSQDSTWNPNIQSQNYHPFQTGLTTEYSYSTKQESLSFITPTLSVPTPTPPPPKTVTPLKKTPILPIPKSSEDYQQDVLIQQEFQRLDQLLLRDDDLNLLSDEDEEGGGVSQFCPISAHQQNMFRFNSTSGGNGTGNGPTSGNGNGNGPPGLGHANSNRIGETQSEGSTRSSSPPVNSKMTASMMGVSHGDGIWSTCPEMSARMYLPNGILVFKLEYQPSPPGSAGPASASTSVSSSSTSTSSPSHGSGQSQGQGLLAKFTHPNIHILPCNDSTRVNVAFDVIYQSH